MPTFEIIAPDGSVYQVDGPEGSTEQDAMQQVMAQQAPSGQNAGELAAVGMGLANAVPFGQRITSGLGAVGAALLSPDLGFKDIPALYNQAQANTQVTAEANPTAASIGTAAGVLPTLALGGGLAKWAGKPLMGGDGALQTGVNLAGRMTKGALAAAPVGAAYSAGAAPTIEDMPEAAKTGAQIAGALGAGIPLAGAMGGAALMAAVPKINEGLREVGNLALKYNIPLSVNQLSSSRALKNVQKVSQELPFSGQEAFQDRQISAWQRALLKTVGVNGDRVTPVTMDAAFRDVGKEFDALGKGKTFEMGEDFNNSLDAIRSDAKSVATKDALDNFESLVSRINKNIEYPRAKTAVELHDPYLGTVRQEAKLTPIVGKISGEQLSTLRSEINRLARKTNNFDTKELFHDLENAVIDVMTSGDDAVAGALSAAKQKYKNLLVIEPLAAKGKAGNISPTLLNARVSKVYGRTHTRGKAGEIGDLARIGHELLPELGGSDTTQKMFYAGGALGGVAAAPMTTAAALTANRAMQGMNRNQALVGKMLNKDYAKSKSDFLSKKGKK